MGSRQKALIKLTKDPLFYIGLAIRLALLFIAVPFATTAWYAPFLENSVASFSLDPWQAHIAQGGDARAFPYGYVMWLMLLPGALVAKLIGASYVLTYGLTLLLVDACLLFLLRFFFQIKSKLLLLGFWLSPITIFATYWLGFNDLIPVTLLLCGLFFLRAHRPSLAGAVCGMALSAKLSMVLAIPFFMVYLYRNRSLRHLLGKFTLGVALSLIVFWVPFLFSSAGLMMLFENPEMQKTFEFAIKVSDSINIYVLPLAYCFTLYVAWQVRRITFELFYAILSIVFLLVLMLSPAAPGWFLWFLPMVLVYMSHGKIIDFMLLSGFSILYVALVFVDAQQPELFGADVASQLAGHINEWIGPKGKSILNTVLFVIAIILGMRIWRGAVSENDYFRLSRKPLVLGVAGDSGAGKDFLVDSLKNLFGEHSVVQISGDDYHLWDRHKPMWQVLTHLNPKANDLERFTKDLLALIDGKSIMSRHYDHETGKMTKPRKINSNDFILASGLHTLHLPILRGCYDLSIYLDIDEDLRRYFKVQRDVHVRGHTLEKVMASLKKRAVDSKKFIRPQSKYADIVLSLKPENVRALDGGAMPEKLRLKLEVLSRHGFYEESLRRVLVGICGLNVDMAIQGEQDEISFSIEGDVTGDDIAMAAKHLFPEMQDFLDSSPVWLDGVSGLMQLITLSHVNQALSKRLL